MEEIMNRLADKVALITGGALGIGAACAARLLQEGAKVAIVDILDAEGQALAMRLGSDARYYHADTSSESDVKRAVADVLRDFGRLDVLVNNAGISGANKPTHEITEEEWDRVQAINVKGVFFCTKHAYPPMRDGGGGSIINLSSIYGLVGAADIPPYHASKGAVRMMSKVDALFYARDGIRVNSIHPGFIWTPMVEHFANDQGGDVARRRKDLDELHPIGHVGEPDDIAWAVVYLASEEAKFVTGSELVVDGGYCCR
jgi:NAD(P)-dependent dehydrogenase (short-subunit alcohol dehydrogenase family)